MKHRPMRAISLLFPALVLSGCQLLRGPEPSAPATARWQGTIRVAGDQARFTPCHEARQFSLALPRPVLESAQALARGRDSVFLDMHASQREAEVAGTDGALQLTTLLRLQGEGHACDEPGFARLLLRASGAEPDWSLEVSARGMLLERPGQAPLALPYLTEQLPGGARHFSSEANDLRVELWVAPQPCEHSASGTLSNLSARLTLNGETLSGCAYPGGASDD